eukprot:10221310-Alexandrium_andersonii.AAC.1
MGRARTRTHTHTHRFTHSVFNRATGENSSGRDVRPKVPEVVDKGQGPCGALGHKAFEGASGGGSRGGSH